MFITAYRSCIYFNISLWVYHQESPPLLSGPCFFDFVPSFSPPNHAGLCSYRLPGMLMVLGARILGLDVCVSISSFCQIT